MPNYSLVINSQFKPFTYEELSRPVDNATEAHRELEDAYAKLDSDAATLASQISKENDPKAYERYLQFENAVNAGADQLLREGLTPTGRSKYYNIHKQYVDSMTPIQVAIADRNEQRKFQMEHPDYIFQHDLMTPGYGSSLDRWLETPNYNYGMSVKESDLYTRASKMAENLTKELKDFQLRGAGYEGLAYLSKKYNLSSEDIINYINNPDNQSAAAIILGAMERQILASTGMNAWGLKEGDTQLNRARNSMQSGFWNGIGQEDISIFNLPNIGYRGRGSSTKTPEYQYIPSRTRFFNLGEDAHESFNNLKGMVKRDYNYYDNDFETEYREKLRDGDFDIDADDDLMLYLVNKLGVQHDYTTDPKEAGKRGYDIVDTNYVDKDGTIKTRYYNSDNDKLRTDIIDFSTTESGRSKNKLISEMLKDFQDNNETLDEVYKNYRYQVVKESVGSSTTDYRTNYTNKKESFNYGPRSLDIAWEQENDSIRRAVKLIDSGKDGREIRASLELSDPAWSIVAEYIKAKSEYKEDNEGYEEQIKEVNKRLDRGESVDQIIKETNLSKGLEKYLKGAEQASNKFYNSFILPLYQEFYNHGEEDLLIEGKLTMPEIYKKLEDWGVSNLIKKTVYGDILSNDAANILIDRLTHNSYMPMEVTGMNADGSLVTKQYEDLEDAGIIEEEKNNNIGGSMFEFYFNDTDNGAEPHILWTVRTADDTKPKTFDIPLTVFDEDTIRSIESFLTPKMQEAIRMKPYYENIAYNPASGASMEEVMAALNWLKIHGDAKNQFLHALSEGFNSLISERDSQRSNSSTNERTTKGTYSTTSN